MESKRGILLTLVASAGLGAPLYEWLLSARLDWYLLLIPSVVALVLLALASMKSISIEAANVKLSAEPILATGGQAPQLATPQEFTMPAFSPPPQQPDQDVLKGTALGVNF